MRHSQERNTQFSCVIHHEALHVSRDKRSGLVQDRVLSKAIRFSGMSSRLQRTDFGFVVE
jgi:hypothetical protein